MIAGRLRGLGLAEFDRGLLRRDACATCGYNRRNAQDEECFRL
jgi:hypothetical protein